MSCLWTAKNVKQNPHQNSFKDLDYQGREHQHGCEVDADNGLEVVVLVVVCGEADDVEDQRREEHVGRDRDQLSRQDELHLFHLFVHFINSSARGSRIRS